MSLLIPPYIRSGTFQDDENNEGGEAFKCLDLIAARSRQHDLCIQLKQVPLASTPAPSQAPKSASVALPVPTVLKSKPVEAQISRQPFKPAVQVWTPAPVARPVPIAPKWKQIEPQVPQQPFKPAMQGPKSTPVTASQQPIPRRSNPGIDFEHDYYRDLGVQLGVGADSIKRGFESKCIPPFPPPYPNS